jgi:hypothetical protein
MGGYNSTRWGWHRKAATVQESKRLPVKDVLAGGPGTRVLCWMRRGEPSSKIGYRVQPGMTQIRLVYTATPNGGEPKAYDYPVDVVSVRTAAGMTQQLWRCPLTVNGVACGRLVRYLALPPGSDYFGCRHCHRLVYASSQEHNKSYDYIAALNRGDLAGYYKHLAHAPRFIRDMP